MATLSQEVIDKYPTIKEWKDDVYTIENFITEQEAAAMIKYLENLVETGRLKWNQISFYDSFAMGFWDSDPILPEFGLPEDYFNRLKFKFKKAGEEIFGHKFAEISYHAQKWIEGAFAGFHSDNSSLDSPDYNAFERSKMATFLYLNDDFEGGELNFRDHDIRIKPTKGLLAAFEGGHHNIHEVLPIEKGTRYTIGSFWDFDEIQYSDETKARWEEEISEARIQQAKDAEEWAQMRERGERLLPGPGVSSKPAKELANEA